MFTDDKHRRASVSLAGGLFALAALIGLPLWGSCTVPLRGMVRAAATPAEGGRKPVTFETVYGPGRVNFDGHYRRGLKWLPDGRHFLERRAGIRQKVDALSDEGTPAYDHEALEAALLENPAFDEGTAARLARRPTELSDDFRVALVSEGNQLFVYHFDDQKLTCLTEARADRQSLTLSPDNTYVAFGHDNDLYTINLTTAAESRMTLDGSETVLNGVLDWVYQEEIYGRGRWRSYWWSDEGQYLAYLQLDESEVPVHTIVDNLPRHPVVSKVHYPKAGDPNPKPRLGVVQPAGGDTVWVDLARYGDTELLIVNVGWSPANTVVFCVQDREQRWLELNLADPETGASRMVLRETSPAWTDSYGLPHWLDDGTFLWRSARDGWPHLYHYSGDGRLLRRLTEGPWEVRRLHGVDRERGHVYLSGTRDSHVESHAYRVPLAGGDIERLTEPGFHHSVNFDPQFNYFIDTFSNLTTPTEVHLCAGDGELVRVLSENNVTALGEYQCNPAEVLRIPTDLGHELNATIYRPSPAGPGLKHPVICMVYGAPHATSVRNEWSGGGFAFKQMLAQQGYLVWTCDPYSASGEGAVSAWHSYQRLGVTETEDLEASLRWLAKHENADLERVAIIGHSYGGYMAAYALTHSRMFSAGIAASVLTDWRNYDSVYAERYLRTPANNPDGYEESSAVSAAANLHGRLLLLHGALDDNVHIQNVLQMADELQHAGQQFELMIYPGDGHGLHRNARHWQVLQMDFIERNLEEGR